MNASIAKFDQEWFMIDDNFFKVLTDKEVFKLITNTHEPVILFYKKKTGI